MLVSSVAAQAGSLFVPFRVAEQGWFAWVPGRVFAAGRDRSRLSIVVQGRRRATGQRRRRSGGPEAVSGSGSAWSRRRTCRSAVQSCGESSRSGELLQREAPGRGSGGGCRPPLVGVGGTLCCRGRGTGRPVPPPSPHVPARRRRPPLARRALGGSSARHRDQARRGNRSAGRRGRCPRPHAGGDARRGGPRRHRHRCPRRTTARPAGLHAPLRPSRAP